MKAQNRAAQGALSASGFPHDTKGLALLNRKADVIHSVEVSAGNREVFFQMVDLDQLWHGASPSLNVAKWHLDQCSPPWIPGSVVRQIS